jgi:hypothetical protein
MLIPDKHPTASSTSRIVKFKRQDMPFAQYTTYALFSLLITLYYQLILCMPFSLHITLAALLSTTYRVYPAR